MAAGYPCLRESWSARRTDPKVLVEAAVLGSTSEVEHVLATQALPLKQFKTRTPMPLDFPMGR